MSASPAEHNLSQTDRPVPLLDVSRANEPLRAEILEAIARVYDSGRFLHGPEVGELEQSLAAQCGVAHAVGCASGSDALLLALMALDIGPGDDVIVPSFTFFATASAAWRLGARVVFADIKPQTFNIDPAHVEALITPATRAIIPVHLFGQAAPMDTLCELAERHRLHIVEDAAQSIGARYGERAAGAWGRVGCFSFYPTKNLGGFGDGGMMTTDDDAMAERLRLLAGHGMQPRYYHSVVGINSRLDTFQAAALNVKLRYLSAATEARRKNASRYDELFRDACLDTELALPTQDAQCYHVWNQYTIRVPAGRRTALRQFLSERGIGSEIYYPVPLHLQQCFRPLGYRSGCLPETERAAEEVLSLPIFPELTTDEQATVVRQIRRFYAGHQTAAA